MLYQAKKKIRRLLALFYNFITPPERIETSKQKWTKLAQGDPRGYVVTDPRISTDEIKFRESGKEAYARYIKNDVLLQQKLQETQVYGALDIGCGVGRITEFFIPDFKKVYGTDIAGPMITEARKRLPSELYTFYETDGLRLPLANEAVDFVFSFATFQHMPDVQTISINFQEAFRVLKSGGIFKVQLRGSPVLKKHWYHGASINEVQGRQMALESGFAVIQIEHESDRNLWLLLQKPIRS